VYEIKVKANFSSAHNLRNYKGKCERLHGHNWIVEAVFKYRSLDRDGMAVDFHEAKRVLKLAIEELDHSYLNDIPAFRKVNPTSENIARCIYGRISRKNGRIYSVSVWENENSCATYSEGVG
jgi:6-pyruvoyltetrahydropterin/6-carboxytetrahydropterin synthase